MDSDMDLILDMVDDDNIIFENIESGKNNEYYQCQAENVLKNIDTNEHYFHFVMTIIKKYHTLSQEQQELIQNRIGIRPKVVEKIIIKEKIIYKQSKKTKLNINDDY